jgi:lysophospholipase L1-like esterase
MSNRIIYTFILFTCAAHLQAQPAGKVKIACIGASITYGARLKNPVKESYPAQLQTKLGDGYDTTGIWDPVITNRIIPLLKDLAPA